MSQQDYEHLQRDFGVTGVMSFCDNAKDEAKIENYIELPFPDDGGSIPSKVIHDTLDWAKEHLSREGTILYVHCALGGSRGPSMSYAICRGVLKMTPDEVFDSIKIGHPIFIGWKENWNPKQYIQDIEEALLIWPGQS